MRLRGYVFSASVDSELAAIHGRRPPRGEAPRPALLRSRRGRSCGKEPSENELELLRSTDLRCAHGRCSPWLPLRLRFLAVGWPRCGCDTRAEPVEEGDEGGAEQHQQQG